MQKKIVLGISGLVILIVCLFAIIINGNKHSVSKFSGKKMKLTVSFPGATWYVRPDGGTRYSTNVPTGQCDGKADAPAPATGVVNGHCAFKDFRMLFQDGSYNTATSFPAWGWVIAGGDTAIVRGSISDNVSYRIGWNGSTYDGWGIAGDSIDSGIPPPPSGTASQHTQILGENYSACHTAGAKTQLHGGWGAFNVLDMSNASYVDVACFDITDFSACGKASQKVACDATQDFSQVGVKFTNLSTNDTLTNLHIHGLAGSALFGPTGDGVALKYVDMIGNASSGWNTDNGTTGVGSLLVQNFNIIGNGCAEQYPIVYPAANAIGDCTDQGSGGYGDGFGTATITSPPPGWQVHFDQGTVAYNTQDGIDAYHIGGAGSTMTDTRVLAYGNEGQQLKVGGATVTIQSSIINGNCLAMSPGNIISGFTSNAFAVLNTLCRAGNTAIAIDVTPTYPATFQGNTIFTQGAIGLEIEYTLGTPASNNTLKYNNNVFVGFFNSGNGANPTPIYGTMGIDMLTNPGASWTNNAYFGYRSNWQCSNPGESKAICTDPGLIDETYHPIGYGNVAPISTTSAVINAGVVVPNLVTDFSGMLNQNVLGALALGSVLNGFEPPQGNIPPTPPPSLVPWYSNTPQIVDGNSVTFTSTVTVRYGQNVSTCVSTYQTCVAGQPSPANWLAPVTIVATTANPVTITVGTTWAESDPNPGVYKQLEFQQLQSTNQTVTVADNNGVKTTVTIPAVTPVVVPVAPTITWGTPTAVVAGTVLSATQLNATASTAGKFVYTPAIGTIPAIGTDTLSVAFTPTDTTHFTNAAATVKLTVAPISVTCTKPIVLTPLSASPWYSVTGCK